VTDQVFIGEAWPLRAPCKRCGFEVGTITTKQGQDVVTCTCGLYSHAAPKAETGREQRTLRTRPDIKPGQRARIFLRDGAACYMCHRDDTQLDVGHLIAVDLGRKGGMTDEEIWHDDNLVVMCAACNSGLSNAPIPLRLAMRVWWLHHRSDGAA